MSRFLSESSGFEREICEKIGFVSCIFARNYKYREFQFYAIQLWVRVPILLNQVKILFDGNGEAVGYLSWAKVSAKTLEKVMRDELYIMHRSEWNDGDIVLLMDICVNEKHFNKSLNFFKREGFANEKIIVSIGRKGINKGKLKFWRGDESGLGELTKANVCATKVIKKLVSSDV